MSEILHKIFLPSKPKTYHTVYSRSLTSGFMAYMIDIGYIRFQIKGRISNFIESS